MATGNVSFNSRDIGGGATIYSLAWTSDASGAVNYTFDSQRGFVKHLKHIPGSGGNQPTDLYDVTITDVDGIDILQGKGANFSNAAGGYIVQTDSAMILIEAQQLTLNIANAGNTKQGRLDLLVWL